MKYAMANNVMYCIHGPYPLNAHMIIASFATRASSISTCGWVFHGRVCVLKENLVEIKRDRTGSRLHLPLGPLS